ncbi:MAG: ribosome-associated translation inhibitor RaiA [Planctomycetota bacterium]
MQVSISARHGNLQPGDQELIEEKVSKLRRLNNHVTGINVTVDLSHLDDPQVEIVTTAEGLANCVGRGNATTVISALDLAIPKVEQQLRRAKEKATGHRATGHKHIETPVATDE